MSQEVRELLAQWVAENVQAAPAGKVEDEAVRLAAEFLIYAKDAGCSAADLADLQDDIGEDLVGHMTDALTSAGPDK